MKMILMAAGVALMTSCGVAAEKLGDGFAPLEWIESTGGQYIDTGVDAGAHTTIDMSFGHCVYGNGSTLFGKDVWDPQGFLFILQQGKFRFFVNAGTGAFLAPAPPQRSKTVNTRPFHGLVI